MPYVFSRSFLLFRSDRVNHTPRLQLDAVCTVTARAEVARQFVPTTACVGENNRTRRPYLPVSADQIERFRRLVEEQCPDLIPVWGPG